MKGVVAAGHEVTANAAADMLRAGGNAFDAALAGMVASGIPEIVLSSLGGGGFMMAYVADRDETVLYDFFAQTPKQKRPTNALDFHAIHADFGPATQEFHIGAGSTATPGMIPGLFAIHRDLCTLPTQELFEPARFAAREGVEVSAFHAYLFTVIEPILTSNPEAKALFAPSGSLLKQGDHFRNPDFADLLDALSFEGERLFREGELASTILAQSKEYGGHLTGADLCDYKVERRKPLVQQYHNHTFYLNPAPCAGGPLIGFSLGLLEHICQNRPPDLLDLVNVMSLTNKARSERNCDLEDFASAKHIRHHIEAASGHHPSSRGTTHLSVIDARGTPASLTTSNGEGNGLMLGSTGFMLNNMLGEEDLHEQGFHRWSEDQRLSSMMAPTLMRAPDKGITAFGSGGSNRIRSALLQVASGLIDHDFSLRQAIEAPRLHTEKSGKISYEDKPGSTPFTPVAKQQLLKAYPQAQAWPQPNMFFGGVHTVKKSTTGQFEGMADPRRDGFAINLAR